MRDRRKGSDGGQRNVKRQVFLRKHASEGKRVAEGRVGMADVYKGGRQGR